MDVGSMTVSGRVRARRAARGPVVEGAARAGFAARGAIYLLVGLLAARVAAGSDHGRQADREGALAEIAHQPLGTPLLWALAVGLAGMALWRLSEALFGAAGADGHKARKRLLSGARCLFYGFVAYTVSTYALGERRSEGGAGDRTSQDLTARLLDVPGGRWLVGAAGVVAAGAGVWIAVRAARRTHRDRMRLDEMSPRTRLAVDCTGVAGGVSRGAVFATAGGFALWAAIGFAPGRAKGVDDTLRSFAHTPAGPWLLVAVAAGLALFGLFSFAMARWRKF
ncbi:DUF1206 domain-containing protein [Streptomyces melanogenes]|uniref:DUF1206 domain-containing protein n=1 Tax=Streptomyces melanogenes TaxID=67326 RepID=A0ABZ1XUZ2_9ACTN|nr:DUF1206 domain-containing protein [Streptomyces melanogenes]